MASVTLGPVYASGTNSGIQWRAIATSSTDSSKGYIRTVVQLCRVRSSWYIDGTMTFTYKFGAETVTRTVKYDGSAATVGEWVDLDEYTYSFALNEFSSVTLAVGFSSKAVTSGLVGADADLGTSNIVVGPHTTYIPKVVVKLYSNYADYGTLQGAELSGISPSTNVLVYTHSFERDTEYPDGLCNIQNSSYLYLSRSNYNPTGNWGTEINGGILISQVQAFTGQSLAEDILKLCSGELTEDIEVSLYAQWEFDTDSEHVRIFVNHNGQYKSGTLYARKSLNEQFKPVKELYNRNSTEEEFSRLK